MQPPCSHAKKQPGRYNTAMVYGRWEHVCALWRTHVVKAVVVVPGLILLCIHWRDQFVEHPTTIREILSMLPFSLSVWEVICAVAILAGVGEASYELVRKSHKEIERLKGTFDQVQQIGNLRFVASETEQIAQMLLASRSSSSNVDGADQKYPLNDGWQAGLDQRTRACCELYFFQRVYGDFCQRSMWAISGLSFKSRVSKNSRPIEATVTELHEMLLEHKAMLNDQAATLLATAGRGHDIAD